MQKKIDQSAENANSARNTGFVINDPEQFAQNMARLIEQSGKAFAQMIERSGTSNGPLSGSDEISESAKTMAEVYKHWLNQPARLAEAQGDLMRGYAGLWNNTVKRMMGQPSQAVVEPERGDNRFRDPDWSENQYFDFCKQTYLLLTQWAEELVEKTEGMDERSKQRAEFFLRQISSAFSPSNFVLTNPEVMRETLSSNAENLVKGMEHFAQDLSKGGDLFKITQTDTDAFEVGSNLAITPGKVVFENDVFQLIQYTPSTPKVHSVPLLIAPPWINKFYILDLVPQKSFIKYVVEQGFTTFVISWVNPDEELAHKTFEDYIHEGLLTAADVVCEIADQPHCNVLGYCVGGTLLGTTLAWLAARNEEPFKSATFLTAQVDFSKAGDLLVFIDEAQLRSLEEMMTERGYLDGSRMANVFNMLRPRDLIWPYIVNNYLLGKKPFPFDLLFWNQDSTRMPAANHAFYLREFYQDNQLAEGKMVISGERLDLSKVTLPIYELATREDHIAPAKSVFIGSRMFSSPVRFVLAGSGHIAGVVNPPEKHKYQYWTNESSDAETLKDWLETAEEHPGSWWPDWTAWLANQSGVLISARIPGDGPFKALEDAPGSYVMQKS